MMRTPVPNSNGKALLKFTRETTSALLIRSVSENRIRIGDRSFEHPIAITANAVLEDWPGKAIDELGEDDFDALLDENPDVIVLGTGSDSRFPPRELTFAMARRGIGLEVMDSGAAARTFNVLAGEGRRVVGVFYL